MRKHVRNRIFQTVVILVILSGAIVLITRKPWKSRTEPSFERVSEPPTPQDTRPAGRALPRAARTDEQPLVEKSFPVGPIPGVVPADKVPIFPPASTFTLPALPEEERLENRLAEMDAFTAAKYLYDLQEAGTTARMRALAAQAYAENPDDFEVVQFWAARNSSHPWQGSNPEGIAARRKLLEMRPNSPEVLIELSAALWYTEPEETLVYLEKAARLTSGTDPGIVKLKAKVYQRMGDYETALDILKTYRDTELIPSNPLIEELRRPLTITIIDPLAYYDDLIHAIEEGKPWVEPHPRYLEAQRRDRGRAHCTF